VDLTLSLATRPSTHVVGPILCQTLADLTLQAACPQKCLQLAPVSRCLAMMPFHCCEKHVPIARSGFPSGAVVDHWGSPAGWSPPFSYLHSCVTPATLLPNLVQQLQSMCVDHSGAVPTPGAHWAPRSRHVLITSRSTLPSGSATGSVQGITWVQLTSAMYRHPKVCAGLQSQRPPPGAIGSTQGMFSGAGEAWS